MTGNFDKYDPTPAQVNALYSLCKMFMKQFAIKKENILGHRELEGVTKAVLVIVFYGRVKEDIILNIEE